MPMSSARSAVFLFFLYRQPATFADAPQIPGTKLTIHPPMQVVEQVNASVENTSLVAQPFWFSVPSVTAVPWCSPDVGYVNESVTQMVQVTRNVTVPTPQTLTPDP